MPELVGGGWILEKYGWHYTYQSSWQASPNEDEIVECLEQAYQEKMDGSIEMRKKQADDQLSAQQQEISMVSAPLKKFCSRTWFHLDAIDAAKFYEQLAAFSTTRAQVLLVAGGSGCGCLWYRTMDTGRIKHGQAHTSAWRASFAWG